MLTNFGKLLKKIRIDHNEILKTMAQKLGVSSAFLSAVETGKKNVPAKWVNQIVALYGLSDAEAAELSIAAQESIPVIKLDMTKSNPHQRAAALVFARSFDTLSEEQADELINSLKTNSRDKGGGC